MSMSELGDPEIIHLPPGFRFHPTDEEIITHYLTEKVMNSSFTAIAISEVDLNKSEPWDLSKKAKMGEKEWYFFTQKDRKYPTGLRTNRATESGYWKATGKDKEIYRGKNCLVGMKKTLVFYLGRAPKGEKTNWVMHEYRLEGKFSYSNLPKVSKDEWVVCRIFHKSTGIKKLTSLIMPKINSSMCGDDLLSGSLPPLMEPASSRGPSSSLADAVDNEFKGMVGKGSSIQISRSSDANFPCWSLPFDPCQGLIMGSNPCPTYPLNLSSNFSVLNDQVHNPNFLSVQASAINPTYLPDQAQHEVDPFSNRSMISSRSQETALSTDKNSEISSSTTALKQELTSNRPIDDQTEDPLVGLSNSSDILDFTWDY